MTKNLFKESTPPNVLIKVSEKDLAIIRRATAILSNGEKWNRKDDRHRSKKAKIFSLYCALYKATVEINGEFDHRLAALEEVRRTVEEVSKNKAYEHRLMGFNNDVATTYKDIEKVLSTTELRLNARLKKELSKNQVLPP